MADLIDRQALGVGRCSPDILPAAYCAGWNGLLNLINEAPAVDAVEAVHGRWIFGHTIGHAWMKCSECLKSQMPNGCFTYCPNCGAKMDGERREENAAD